MIQRCVGGGGLFGVALCVAAAVAPCSASAQCDQWLPGEGDPNIMEPVYFSQGGEWLGFRFGGFHAWDGRAWARRLPDPGLTSLSTVWPWGEKLVITGTGMIEGVPQTGVWVWDGATLENLSSPMVQFPTRFAEFDGKLYSNAMPASDFTTAAVSWWDGTRWVQLRVNSGAPRDIVAFAEYEGALYCFNGDGVVWRLRNDLLELVTSVENVGGASIRDAIPVEDGVLVVGAFGTAYGQPALGVAIWNGFDWRRADGGQDLRSPNPTRLLRNETGLYMVGRFPRPGGATAAVMKRDGDGWTADAQFASATGLASSPTDLAISTSSGVYYGQPGGWRALPNRRLDNRVRNMVMHEGSLIASGDFLSAEGVTLNRIARREGLHWIPLGEGLDMAPSSLASFQGRLIAAGGMLNIGNLGIRRIGQWDGQRWLPIGGGVETRIETLAVYQGELLAGGNVSSADGQAARWIAAWNGTSWRQFPNAFNGVVSMLRVVDGQLYASGGFAFEGPRTVNRIARWDGAAWQPLGSGFSFGSAADMVMYGGVLVVGGSFGNAGGVPAPGIATWDGSQWAAFPIAFTNGTVVRDLEVFDGELYIAGTLNAVGSPAGSSLARWNGARLEWLRDGTLISMLARESHLEVGSTLLASSQNEGVYYSRFGCPCAAPTAAPLPASVLLCPGGALTLACEAHGAEELQWRRNGLPIPGAQSPTLVLDHAEAAIYDCLAINDCGTTRVGPVFVRRCDADFGCDGFIDWSDLIAFWDAFEAGEPRADLNRDDFLDFFDAIAMYDAFEAGC